MSKKSNTKRYTFKIYWEDDDENVWIDASSKSEAIYELKSEYPGIKDYQLISAR